MERSPFEDHYRRMHWDHFIYGQRMVNLSQWPYRIAIIETLSSNLDFPLRIVAIFRDRFLAVSARG